MQRKDMVDSPPDTDDKLLQTTFLVILDQAKLMQDAATILSHAGISEDQLEMGAKLANDVYSIALEKKVPAQTAHKAAMEVARELGIILNSSKNLTNETLATMLGKSAYNNLSGVPTRTREIIKQVIENDVRNDSDLTGGGWLKSLGIAALLAGVSVPTLLPVMMPDVPPNMASSLITQPPAVTVPSFTDPRFAIQFKDLTTPNATSSLSSKLSNAVKGYKFDPYRNPSEEYANAVDNEIFPLFEQAEEFKNTGAINGTQIADTARTTPAVRDKIAQEVIQKNVQGLVNASVDLPINWAFMKQTYPSQVQEAMEAFEAGYTQQQRKEVESIYRTAARQKEVEEAKAREKELTAEDDLLNQKLKNLSKEEEIKRRTIPEHGAFFKMLASEQLMNTLAVGNIIYSALRTTGFLKAIWDAGWKLLRRGKRQEIEDKFKTEHRQRGELSAEEREKLKPEEQYEARLEGEAWAKELEKKVEAEIEKLNLPLYQKKLTAEKWLSIIEKVTLTLATVPAAIYSWDRLEARRLLKEAAEVIKQDNKWWDRFWSFARVGASVAGSTVSLIGSFMGNKPLKNAGDKVTKVLKSAFEAGEKATEERVPDPAAVNQSSAAETIGKAAKQFASQLTSQIQPEPLKLPAPPSKPVAVPSKVPIQVREPVTQVQPLTTKGRKSLRTKVIQGFSKSPYLKQTEQQTYQTRKLIQMIQGNRRKQQKRKQKKTRR